jgi:hypothetical protein
MALRTARRLVVRGRPPRSRRRQNWRNPGPRRVGQVGVVESRGHRTVPLALGQHSFKTDVNFSNTLLDSGMPATQETRKTLVCIVETRLARIG